MKDSCTTECDTNLKLLGGKNMKEEYVFFLTQNPDKGTKRKNDKVVPSINTNINMPETYYQAESKGILKG